MQYGRSLPGAYSQYQCFCSPGFKLQSSTQTCVDIDECSLPSSSYPCGPAGCSNIIGSFLCQAFIPQQNLSASLGSNVVVRRMRQLSDNTVHSVARLEVASTSGGQNISFVAYFGNMTLRSVTFSPSTRGKTREFADLPMFGVPDVNMGFGTQFNRKFSCTSLSATFLRANASIHGLPAIANAWQYTSMLGPPMLVTCTLPPACGSNLVFTLTVCGPASYSSLCGSFVAPDASSFDFAPPVLSPGTLRLISAPVPVAALMLGKSLC